MAEKYNVFAEIDGCWQVLKINLSAQAGVVLRALIDAKLDGITGREFMADKGFYLLAPMHQLRKKYKLDIESRSGIQGIRARQYILRTPVEIHPWLIGSPERPEKAP